eukprot:Colp12_sorted_trinity150504_noHs@12894
MSKKVKRISKKNADKTRKEYEEFYKQVLQQDEASSSSASALQVETAIGDTNTGAPVATEEKASEDQAWSESLKARKKKNRKTPLVPIAPPKESFGSASPPDQTSSNGLQATTNVYTDQERFASSVAPQQVNVLKAPTEHPGDFTESSPLIADQGKGAEKEKEGSCACCTIL